MVQGRDTKKSRGRRAGLWVGAAFAGLALGAVAMFGSLYAVNGRVPLPTPTPTPTPTPRQVPSDAWATMPTNIPVAVSTPGTSYAFGAPAQVEVALGTGKHSLVSIAAGTPVVAPEHDLEVLVKTTPQLAGMTVTYIPLTVTKVAGDGLAGVELGPLFWGVSDTGFTMQQLTIRDWRPCSVNPLDASIDTPGTSVTTCVAVAAAKSAPGIAKVRFSQSGGPYDAANGTAVVWQ